MLLRFPPAGFIAPCLPTPILRPPSGPLWVHEIKHDGYRMMAWREGDDVRLYTRRGYDWSERYPSVVAALRSLKVGSCLLDGELVVCDDAGGVIVRAAALASARSHRVPLRVRSAGA
jgi:bifunctional non-homologous end joining protein LigD